ncbi:hypothetical protein Arub01_00280 [Actinomadura rubrobrunea]|uniref:Uncharacterized protein n=1 Tax=Actinomadura rubrobrunea TaxID=115335 RepID=A0A9W6PNJ1_9ACTN|nr:hypothetical protein Arub01_00280 [Actinomadura rubrobrunea]
MLYMLIAIAALGLVGPWLGADSRDGLDWAPNNFWLRRRGTTPPDLRTSGSRARASGGRVAADPRRTAPAAG